MNLILYKVTHSMDNGEAVDIIYDDFSKAFDSLPQHYPGETGCSGLDGWVLHKVKT